ncbi:class I SAM-dependent methyltransferase [Streptomyces sp. NPDC002994]|uniref:class I SAM-dependent methyltransferase n=1 Tax=Streptomyces sp. NPDC002994 TaxID=3154441 RepID=UPI0033B56A21
MSVTSRYKDAWEGFWREAPHEPGAVFWDAEPALTVGLHLSLLEPYMTEPALPVVDLGCGNGTQTLFLADRFPRVAGVDLAAAAIEHAEHHDPAGRIRFQQLDASDEPAVRRLHAELGDAQVYMRGVLHQCEPADRQPVAEAVARLVGERGRAFVVEPSEAAREVLMGLVQGPDGPPPKMRPVFAHGIAPLGMRDAEAAGHFRAAGLAVLASGELPLMTTEYGRDGTRIELPSKWLVVGRSE